MSRSIRVALAATLLLQACASTPPRSPQVASDGGSVVTAAARARIDSALRAYVASGRVAGA